ncbi:hypothetical protein C8J56DRAFT_462218 [Mycena floridula]|nr:hypothetical protein C8J56DRAFT_462218 [Mycena floridula]
MSNALDVLELSGIRLASDTAEYNDISPFKAIDATTNPSLVLAAVLKPEYEHHLARAVEYAKTRAGGIREQTELAMDRLLAQLGFEISRRVPGRVSVSVDPRLAYDTEAIIRKGIRLVTLLEELGLPRDRVLVKIPATYPGILAARSLEHGSSPIYTNMTLVFSHVQALACAQAGLSVISPFIGRVKDWWTANGYVDSSIESHPGILLVRHIRSSYQLLGYKTHIMAAGFRNVDELVEMSCLGSAVGPDFVTIPPVLMEGMRLRKSGALTAPVKSSEISDAVEKREYLGLEGAAFYEHDIGLERIATEKVPEGLEKFSKDAQILEDMIKEWLAREEILPKERLVPTSATTVAAR